ncbi:hypothetical protein OAP63_06655 [Vibrio sp.]|uniref:Fis family transcriptional regulator n=1 Tax=Vibrio viridaestus TaxID=2487322 RepID=A0A3N9TJZ3_9VIBR|nr:hypothetical protein [Vibrio viridaestus]MDC0610397.1 hypothetical protein [Vibrio sp.]RQW64284.1 hypothetical protein EES38_06790 [Vibrio viridaestus]
MKKTDKKLENQLRLVLTEVCEVAKECFEGFDWLTHSVNYNNFPHSLMITCVFSTNHHLELADKAECYSLIKRKLSSISINLKSIEKHVRFDTEENCSREHDGKWNKRLAS